MDPSSDAYYNQISSQSIKNTCSFVITTTTKNKRGWSAREIKCSLVIWTGNSVQNKFCRILSSCRNRTVLAMAATRVAAVLNNHNTHFLLYTVRRRWHLPLGNWNMPYKLAIFPAGCSYHLCSIFHHICLLLFGMVPPGWLKLFLSGVYCAQATIKCIHTFANQKNLIAAIEL